MEWQPNIKFYWESSYINAQCEAVYENEALSCTHISKRRESTIESQLVKTYPDLLEMSHIPCSPDCAAVTLEERRLQDVKDINKKVTIE
jgi:hypothetical protein